MKSKIRVGIVGVGSCASSLVQAVELARSLPRDTALPGIPFATIGGYHSSDIEWACAFDVDSRKVGTDLATAIYAEPNLATPHVKVSPTGVTVQPGPVWDGLQGPLEDVVTVHPRTREVDQEFVVRMLKSTNTEVLICYLPTGSTEAVRSYARAAVEAGVAFINATPELVAGNPELRQLFLDRGIPLLGDDVRSHLGATTLHMALLELMQSRGLVIGQTYQLNIGGNMDFFNMSSPRRAASKQVSKKVALQSAGIDARDVSAGPNGFVKGLDDTKVCYLRIEGTSILNSQVSMEIRLEVEDSPNSAAVIINAVRVARHLLDKEDAVTGEKACPFLFKSPVLRVPESEALRLFSELVAQA